jgi:O-antigen ligase
VSRPQLPQMVGVSAVAVAFGAASVLQPAAAAATAGSIAVIGALAVPLRCRPVNLTWVEAAWTCAFAGNLAALILTASVYSSPLIELARFAFLAALIVVLLITRTSSPPAPGYRLFARAVVVLVVFAAASTLWSISPTTTAMQAVVFIMAATAVLLAGRKRWGDRDALIRDLRLLFWAFTLTTTVGLAGWVVDADWAISGYQQWFSGIYLNPNTVGMTAAIAVPLGVGLIAHSRGLAVKLATTGGVMVLLVSLPLSASRTGLAATIVGVAVVAMASWRFSARYVIPTVWAICTAAVALVMAGRRPDVSGVTGLLLADGGDNLSGRELLWESLVLNWQQNPVAGSGYRTTEVLFQSLRGRGLLSLPQDAAHNGYLQTLSELGSVGLLLVLVLVVASIRGGWRTRHMPMQAGVLGVVVAGWIIQLGESFLFGFGSVFGLPFWMLLVVAARTRMDAPVEEAAVSLPPLEVVAAHR